MGFVDGFGRGQDELRVSVTDRCNLRCTYCMPEEPVWFPRERILRFEEIARLARVFVRRGVSRIRLTGGEPLLRRDLPVLVRLLRHLPGLSELSLTTNGLLLESQAEDLAAAGLDRVNVSLDTLVPERFHRLTGRSGLEKVLRGLEAAEAAGLVPVKINTVLLRGVNEDEIVPLARMARERGREVRFIEFMPLENGRTWDTTRVVSGKEARRTIHAIWPLLADPREDPTAPAIRHRFVDGKGAVGFINSVTEPFCRWCSRLRLTSDGKLTTCLYATEEVDLRAALREGADDGRIESLIERAVAGKERGGALEILERRVRLPLVRTMHQIGG